MKSVLNTAYIELESKVSASLAEHSKYLLNPERGLPPGQPIIPGILETKGSAKVAELKKGERFGKLSRRRRSCRIGECFKTTSKSRGVRSDESRRVHSVERTNKFIHLAERNWNNDSG